MCSESDLATRSVFRLVPVLLALSGCAMAPVEEPPAEPAESPIEAVSDRPAQITAPKQRPSGITISIAAVGDMMLGTDYPENHLPDDDGVGFLKAVTPILSSADITFGNLEGVLVDGGEPGKRCSNPAACYRFRSPSRYVEHFVAAGFDVMSLANNHARDFGEDGRLATMQTLAVAGIHHSGLEGDFASFESNGLRVALIAFAVTLNSNLLLDYEQSARTISEYAETHDIVIVSFHGGAEGRDVMHLPFAEEEYFGEPRGDVVKFSRMMVDAGADLVFGHGPHVVRAMERYKGRLIAYSLGNFATYYGISVEGIKGIAPILVATVDEAGMFIEGQIYSTVQIRPDGPTIDESQKALNLIRGLSIQDFGKPGIKFLPEGKMVPADRRTTYRRRPGIF
jgi:poly-gamma-glutamate capsule biosynthesis protein CapA/YwtB (metallophosphatase superfamily)